MSEIPLRRRRGGPRGRSSSPQRAPSSSPPHPSAPAACVSCFVLVFRIFHFWGLVLTVVLVEPALCQAPAARPPRWRQRPPSVERPPCFRAKRGQLQTFEGLLL